MSELFSPLRIRGLTLKNRLFLAPMCQYSAHDGLADDFHLVQCGRFALGGFGMVMVEATAVSPEGRITHGDIGLWSDGQIEPLARIARFLKANGAVAAIQLAHAGRKGSARRPWRGEGTAAQADEEDLGDHPWPTLAPSAVSHSVVFATPRAAEAADIEVLRMAFVEAARRALSAGFEVLELHCGHGYLLHQFLSPVANLRTDGYGGSLEDRMRLPLAVVSDLRRVWPEDRPLLVRVSVTDHIDGGWALADTVVFAKALKSLGVDMLDCSSGGFEGAALNAFSDYHLPYAAQISRETGLRTMAAGLISNADTAEAAIAAGDVDLVGVARDALIDPNWPLRAAMTLRVPPAGLWPSTAAWSIADRLADLSR